MYRPDLHAEALSSVAQKCSGMATTIAAVCSAWPCASHPMEMFSSAAMVGRSQYPCSAPGRIYVPGQLDNTDVPQIKLLPQALSTWDFHSCQRDFPIEGRTVPSTIETIQMSKACWYALSAWMNQLIFLGFPHSGGRGSGSRWRARWKCVLSAPGKAALPAYQLEHPEALTDTLEDCRWVAKTALLCFTLVSMHSGYEGTDSSPSFQVAVESSCLKITRVFLDVFAPAYAKDKFGPVSWLLISLYWATQSLMHYWTLQKEVTFPHPILQRKQELGAWA